MKSVFLVTLISCLAWSQTCPTPAQLDADLTATSQGAVINLSGVSPLACPEVLMSQTWAGGSLLFSDSPESPSVTGKLYEDSFPATSGTTYNRLFVYHTNGKSSGKGKLTVLIKNNGPSSGTLTIRKKGLAGPSVAYVTVGKLAFQRWLQSTAGSGVSVAAGATVRLDTALEANMNPTNLVNGIYDISMTQPYKATVCFLNQNDNPLTVCPGLAVLPRDVHDRGTFPYADKVFDTSTGTSVDTLDGVQQFPMMWGSPGDDNASGTDATDGTPMVLNGNIGVLYRMHLLLDSSDGQNMGIVANPRGGYWGSAFNVMPGLLPGGIFLCPTSSEGFSDNTKTCVVGRYTPNGGLSVWIQAMMTGGSNAPLRMMLVPH